MGREVGTRQHTFQDITRARMVAPSGVYLVRGPNPFHTRAAIVCTLFLARWTSHERWLHLAL
jgi:hypothetical protein